MGKLLLFLLAFYSLPHALAVGQAELNELYAAEKRAEQDVSAAKTAVSAAQVEVASAEAELAQAKEESDKNLAGIKVTATQENLRLKKEALAEKERAEKEAEERFKNSVNTAKAECANKTAAAQQSCEAAKVTSGAIDRHIKNLGQKIETFRRTMKCEDITSAGDEAASASLNTAHAEGEALHCESTAKECTKQCSISIPAQGPLGAPCKATVESKDVKSRHAELVKLQQGAPAIAQLGAQSGSGGACAYAVPRRGAASPRDPVNVRVEGYGALASAEENADKTLTMKYQDGRTETLTQEQIRQRTGAYAVVSDGTITPVASNSDAGRLIAARAELGGADLGTSVPVDEKAAVVGSGWKTTVTSADPTPRSAPAAAPPPAAPGAPGPRGGSPASGGGSGVGALGGSPAQTMDSIASNPALGQLMAAAAAPPPPAPDQSALLRAQTAAAMTGPCATEPWGQACSCITDPRTCEQKKVELHTGEEVASRGSSAPSTEKDLEKYRADMDKAFGSITKSSAVKPDGRGAGLSVNGSADSNEKDKKLLAAPGMVGSSGAQGNSGMTGSSAGYEKASSAARAKAAAAVRGQWKTGAKGQQVADAPAAEKMDINRFFPRSFGLARRRIAGVQGTGEIAGKFENLFENVNRAYRNNGPQLSPADKAADAPNRW